MRITYAVPVRCLVTVSDEKWTDQHPEVTEVKILPLASDPSWFGDAPPRFHSGECEPGEEGVIETFREVLQTTTWGPLERNEIIWEG